MPIRTGVASSFIVIKMALLGLDIVLWKAWSGMTRRSFVIIVRARITRRVRREIEALGVVSTWSGSWESQSLTWFWVIHSTRCFESMDVRDQEPFT